MDASILNAEENQPRVKVSVSARLITALAYTIPAIGGALSSILLMKVFQAMAMAESAGIMAIMAGLKEATVPTIVSLYLGAVCGIAVIVVLVVRMMTQTKTASPPSWFFAIGGLLCLVPAGLFWKAGSLIIEIFSPGSSIATDGLGSIGGFLADLLWWSLIAAPIVFVFLIVVSVWPLSSRKKSKWSSLIAASAIEILLIAAAIAFPFLIGEPKRKNELVNLPADFKYASIDHNLQKETSIILILTSDNKLYRENRTENVITKEELPEKLKRLSEGMTPDRRIVYLKADINASFENVSQVFDLIRKADIIKVGLVVIGKKNEDDPYQISPVRFEVKLPEPRSEAGDPIVRQKPNPLTLVAMLGRDGRLSLNNEEMGMISDPQKLENRLVEVFKQRELVGAFREGTNEIEKTVFLKVLKSSKYGDFIKLVEAVKAAGAEPIGIQIDELN